MQVFDPGDTFLLHEQVSEYTRLLSQLLRVSKPLGIENREVHEVLFSLFGETLCYRDELDQYLVARDGIDARSILNSASLDVYEELFDFLACDLSPSTLAICDMNEIPSEIPLVSKPACIKLISFSLRAFGSGEELAVKCQSWFRLRNLYFPYLDDEYLRQLYYKESIRSSKGFSRVWTFEEDYHVVTECERFGLNLHSFNSIFIILGETRTLDEIYLRTNMFFYPPKVKRNIKVIKDDHSEWSVDDTLLV